MCYHCMANRGVQKWLGWGAVALPEAPAVFCCEIYVIFSACYHCSSSRRRVYELNAGQTARSTSTRIIENTLDDTARLYFSYCSCRSPRSDVRLFTTQNWLIIGRYYLNLSADGVLHGYSGRPPRRVVLLPVASSAVRSLDVNWSCL